MCSTLNISCGGAPATSSAQHLLDKPCLPISGADSRKRQDLPCLVSLRHSLAILHSKPCQQQRQPVLENCSTNDASLLMEAFRIVWVSRGGPVLMLMPFSQSLRSATVILLQGVCLSTSACCRPPPWTSPARHLAWLAAVVKRCSRGFLSLARQARQTVSSFLRWALWLAWLATCASAMPSSL